MTPWPWPGVAWLPGCPASIEEGVRSEHEEARAGRGQIRMLLEELPTEAMSFEEGVRSEWLEARGGQGMSRVKTQPCHRNSAPERACVIPQASFEK